MQPYHVDHPEQDGTLVPRVSVTNRPPVKVLRQVSRGSGANVPPSLGPAPTLAPTTHQSRSRSRTRRPSPARYPRARSRSVDSVGGRVAIPQVVSEGHVPDDSDEQESSTGGSFLMSTTRGQKLVLVVLAMNDMTSMMALSILAPFFPKEASNKGVSDVVSGWIFGVFALVQCFTSPLFGKKLPHLGARFTCMAGLFFAGGCTILFGFLQFIPGHESNNTLFVVYCFILRIFMAVGTSANSTASFAIAAATFSDNPATVLGLLETAVGIGLMLGPAIGGVLYEVGGFLTPFAVLGSFMVITVPISLCVLPPERQTDGGGDESSGSIKQLLRIPAISITVVSLVVSSCSFVFLDPTLEPHLRPYNLSPSVIGLVFLLMSACYAVCSPIWGWVADNVRDSAPMMIVGLMMNAVGFMLIGPSPLINMLLGYDFRAFWLDIIALIIVGLASSLALVPTYDKILDAGEQAGIQESMANYSAVAGLWNSGNSLGEFLGPVLAGWLVGSLGFGWAMTGLASTSLIMAIVMLSLYFYESKNGPTGVKKPVANITDSNLNESNERSPLLGGNS